MYDIRAELNYRYKDLRSPHKALDSQELYEMLVKDGDLCTEGNLNFLSLKNFDLGKLVNGRVLYVVYRRPNEKDTKGEPTYNDKLNLWRCAFCKRSDFNDISEVWNHTQKGNCPGIPVGVKIKLDNHLMGFVSVKNISDNSDMSSNPTQRLLVFFIF